MSVGTNSTAEDPRTSAPRSRRRGARPPRRGARRLVQASPIRKRASHHQIGSETRELCRSRPGQAGSSRGAARLRGEARPEVLEDARDRPARASSAHRERAGGEHLRAPFRSRNRSSGPSSPARGGHGSRRATRVPRGEADDVWSISMPNDANREPGSRPVPAKTQPVAADRPRVYGARCSPASFPMYCTPINAASGRPCSRHCRTAGQGVAAPVDAPEVVVRREEHEVPAEVAVALDDVVLARRDVLVVAGKTIRS